MVAHAAPAIPPCRPPALRASLPFFQPAGSTAVGALALANTGPRACVLRAGYASVRPITSSGLDLHLHEAGRPFRLGDPGPRRLVLPPHQSTATGAPGLARIIVWWQACFWQRNRYAVYIDRLRVRLPGVAGAFSVPTRSPAPCPHAAVFVAPARVYPA